MIALNRLFLRPLYRVCLFLIVSYGFLTDHYNIAYAEIKGNSPIISANSDDPYTQYKRLVPPNEWFILADHSRIPVRVWHASHQKAIILALHGFNDSRDAWEDAASIFTDAGLTLYAPDQRGFGQAPLRGEWAGSHRMIQDVIEEITILKHRYPDMPLYVMGESMGGAILTCLAADPAAPGVNGYILLAPAVWGHRELGILPDMLLWIFNLMTPNWEVTGRHVPVKVTASDNNDSLIRLYFDPLTIHATRIKALYGLVDLMSQAMTAAGQIRYPMLVLYGDHDQLVPSSAMQKAWKRFPRWVRKDYVPNGYHLLLRDRNRKDVAQDIIGWIENPDQYLPSGGDVSSAVWLSVGK